VAAAIGLDGLHVGLLAERSLDDDSVASGHRTGERVHDEQDPQETEVTCV